MILLATSEWSLSGVISVAEGNERQELLSLTTEIVASFAGNNTVAIGDLPAVIATVFRTLRGVGQGEAEKPACESALKWDPGRLLGKLLNQQAVSDRQVGPDRRRSGPTWAPISPYNQSSKGKIRVGPGSALIHMLERMVSGRSKATELERLLPWNWQAERGAATVDA
jgi:hypothetical protein